MDAYSSPPDLTAFSIEEIGALLFALVFLWLLTTMVTGHFGLWPLVFVVWVACAIYAERKKRKQAIKRGLLHGMSKGAAG